MAKQGIAIDADVVKAQYNSLSPQIKQNAKVILLPVAAQSGAVYGMDNKTGEVVPFQFARATSATLFDQDKNMQSIGANVPRIDYANYSDDAKLLIEKSSTNLISDSADFSRWGGSVLRTMDESTADGFENYWKIEKNVNSSSESVTYNPGVTISGSAEYVLRIY
ncbi:hypothetical protein, partial [Dysgonomonas sp. 520]|uniref:hypothetical protein n=1 Tax=Dysgonomonas sp. 520 TaxID=2302931 RepID=UPI001C877020